MFRLRNKKINFSYALFTKGLWFRVILHALALDHLLTFFKLRFSKIISGTVYKSVKHGLDPDHDLCSASKLFAKVISKRQKFLLAMERVNSW